MERVASIMYLYQNQEEEYKKRHRASNYPIFLNPATRHLLTHLEVLDRDQCEKISETEICQKWWKYREPLMETNPDSSPVTTSLVEVFHLV